MSKKTLRELVEKDIIAPSTMSNVFWLNPSLVCKGERFAKYTEYLTEEEVKREEQRMIKQQGKDFINRLPEEVENKFKYAGMKNPVLDSENEEIHPKHPNQTFFDFDDQNPYKKPDTDTE